MEGTHCTCGEGHLTFGECLRAKHVSFPGVFATRSQGAGSGDRDRQKAWDKELDAFRDARKQGVLPAGTKMPQIKAAMEMSDREGKAFQADTNTFK